MSRLAETIAATAAAPGTVVAWWLGGTGWVFKTPAGAQIWVDPYLSDIARAIFGLARAFPAPIAPEEARPDLVICTHFHEDHLDPVALPIIARSSAARFLCPPSSYARLVGWGVAPERAQIFAVGQTAAHADVTLRATPARHHSEVAGWDVPDPIGVLLDVAGQRIYHSGDTEYDLKVRALMTAGIDVALLVINGNGGNMNAHEAALLGWQLGARHLVPMHHILWADWGPMEAPGTTLDPALFARTYRALGGAGRVSAPAIGEPIVFAAGE